MKHEVRFPYQSGLPADTAINTFWSLSVVATAEDQAAAMAARLEDFYVEDPTPGTVPLMSYMSGVLAATTSFTPPSVRSYNMADPEPRVPISDIPILGFTPDTTGLPEEVACVGSFHGLYEAGVPKARRRGRIYLGPLSQEAVDNVSGRSTLGEALATNLGYAMANLAFANDAEASWVVYSRVAEEASVVIGGWVDRAWDTQRRRGIDTPVRLPWGV